MKWFRRKQWTNTKVIFLEILFCKLASYQQSKDSEFVFCVKQSLIKKNLIHIAFLSFASPPSNHWHSVHYSPVGLNGVLERAASTVKKLALPSLFQFLKEISKYWIPGYCSVQLKHRPLFIAVSWSWNFPEQIFWLSKPSKNVVACFICFTYTLNKQAMDNALPFSCLQPHSK